MSIFLHAELFNDIDCISHLLTFIALVLAYVGFVWSVKKDFDSLYALLLSFQDDLKYAESWLGRDGYTKETYKDKKSFSPVKVIYPLAFESLSEIIRKGVGGSSGITRDFSEKLALFYERIIAFNSILDNQRMISCANPVLTERLQEKLNELGIKKDEEELSFESFKKSIEALKEDKNSEELYYFATDVRRTNYNLHVELIANEYNLDRLNYLYKEIRKELDLILLNFRKKQPPFVYYWPSFVTVSIILFVGIEYFFA